MYELSQAEYGKVMPIFADVKDNRAHVFAVIEGNNPGRVFVDDREEPAAALVHTGWSFLGGDATNAAFNQALKTLLEDDIMPSTKDGHVLIYSFSDDWKDVVDELLRDRGVRRVDRTVLDLGSDLFRRRHTGWQERVPEGYRVARVDRALAEQLADKLDNWGTIGGFLSNGFGFCVLKGAEIVSRCHTVYASGGFAETAVGTEEGYRRQGLGSLAACAYIEHGLDKGISAEWGCFYNEASAAMAQKLGFVIRRDVQVNYVKVS
jgi:RimJ/RimL family protein N-acetyltransferase